MKRELDCVEKGGKVLYSVVVLASYSLSLHCVAREAEKMDSRSRRSASPSPSPTDGKSKYVSIIVASLLKPQRMLIVAVPVSVVFTVGRTSVHISVRSSRSPTPTSGVKSPVSDGAMEGIYTCT